MLFGASAGHLHSCCCSSTACTVRACCVMEDKLQGRADPPALLCSGQTGVVKQQFRRGQSVNQSINQHASLCDTMLLVVDAPQTERGCSSDYSSCCAQVLFGRSPPTHKQSVLQTQKAASHAAISSSAARAAGSSQGSVLAILWCGHHHCAAVCCRSS